MFLVMDAWLLAMTSGLCWARRWTALFTIATALAFLGTQGVSLTHWTGWWQGLAMLLSPWLLASQRGHDEYLLTQLHATEAKKAMQLSEAARALLSLQAATQQLETQITEITDVYHVTKETARALHLSELFDASLETAPRLLTARGFRLIDLSDAAAPHVLRATRLSEGRLVPDDTTPTLLDMEQAIVKETLAAGRPAIGTAEQLSCALPETLSRVAWAPLWREQRPIGVLIADELPDEQLKMLAIIANQLSLQLSRIRLYQQVESLAVTDALTGLFVRRHFLERAASEVERSTRHQLSCTVLMVDLDHFKEKNDTYGHLVGDVVLREVAQQLKRNLREIDLIARYGGEEFILLLIETSVEQALPIAQRLKQLIEVHPIRAYDELLTQTISIGVAGFPEDASSLQTLIDRADQALYAAKRAGRNRVMRAAAAATATPSA